MKQGWILLFLTVLFATSLGEAVATSPSCPEMKNLGQRVSYSLRLRQLWRDYENFPPFDLLLEEKTQNDEAERMIIQRELVLLEIALRDPSLVDPEYFEGDTGLAEKILSEQDDLLIIMSEVYAFKWQLPRPLVGDYLYGREKFVDASELLVHAAKKLFLVWGAWDFLNSRLDHRVPPYPAQKILADFSHDLQAIAQQLLSQATLGDKRVHKYNFQKVRDTLRQLSLERTYHSREAYLDFVKQHKQDLPSESDKPQRPPPRKPQLHIVKSH